MTASTPPTGIRTAAGWREPRAYAGQAERAAVVVKVRDQATIRTNPPGSEIGLELREAVAQWPEDRRDLWEGRAAILEYDAGLPRPIAERRAYQIVRDANEAAVLMAEVGQ